jgi:hypothetical protein
MVPASVNRLPADQMEPELNERLFRQLGLKLFFRHLSHP